MTRRGPPRRSGPMRRCWRAVPSPQAPALAELLSEPGVGLSGLRLEGGAVILKVERGEGSVQIRIADGAAFDPAGGIALRLPMALDLQVRLRRMADLWPIAVVETKKDADRGSRTRSC